MALHQNTNSSHLKVKFGAFLDILVWFPHTERQIFMSSLCGVGVRVRVCVRVNNFSKTTRPRDMLFLKDTLSIEDEKVFKAYKSVCLFVC